MLVEFKVGNFLSIKDPVTLSMVGYSPLKEHENINESCNIFQDPSGKNKMLKSAILYGANGSGKSNFLTAMQFVKQFILTSSNDRQASDSIDVLPFKFSTQTENQPSLFEIIFHINDARYRYGFEADREKVHYEWLFELKNKPSAKETRLFTREFQDIKPNSRSFKEAKGIKNNTRPNALFLSTVAQLNGALSTEILSWFKTDFNVISGLEDTTTEYTISKFLKDKEFKNLVIDFFKTIQIGFDGIEVIEDNKAIEESIQNIPTEISDEVTDLLNAFMRLREKTKDKDEDPKHVTINTLHKIFNSKNKPQGLASLDFNLQSKGTIKIFSLLGPVIDTVQNGKTLIIDEFDSRLHTLLTTEIIANFFHSKMNSNAQLIIASHNTNLLKKEIFRRDQIWFTEKDEFGATDLYSLVEYKINQSLVRNDASFEKDYLLGKYGAIPFLGNLKQFIKDYLNEQKKAQEKV